MRRPDDPRHLEELWRYEGLRVGSVAAMRDLVDLHHDEMVRLARVHVTPEHVPAVVRRSFSTALGGLSMFVWHSSFRSWLMGILLAEARASRERVMPAAPGRLLAARPERALGSEDLGELPWTGWWAPHTWSRLQAWLDRRPTIEQEAVILREVLGWPVDEARDVLGWTDAAADEVHQHLLTDLAHRLADEMDLDVVPPGVADLLAQLPTAPIVAQQAVLLGDYRRWRTDRGLTVPRRLAGRIRRRRLLSPPDSLLPVPH